MDDREYWQTIRYKLFLKPFYIINSVEKAFHLYYNFRFVDITAYSEPEIKCGDVLRKTIYLELPDLYEHFLPGPDEEDLNAKYNLFTEEGDLENRDLVTRLKDLKTAFVEYSPFDPFTEEEKELIKYRKKLKRTKGIDFTFEQMTTYGDYDVWLDENPSLYDTVDLTGIDEIMSHMNSVIF